MCAWVFKVFCLLSRVATHVFLLQWNKNTTRVFDRVKQQGHGLLAVNGPHRCTTKGWRHISYQHFTSSSLHCTSTEGHEEGKTFIVISCTDTIYGQGIAPNLWILQLSFMSALHCIILWLSIYVHIILLAFNFTYRMGAAQVLWLRFVLLCQWSRDTSISSVDPPHARKCWGIFQHFG